KDDVTGLLAADREIALDHLFHHIFVADGTAHEIDPALPQRDLQPDVAHHRRDDPVALQAFSPLPVTSAHQEDGIAINDSPCSISENGAVSIAIERHSHPAPEPPDRPGNLLGMC